MIEYLLYGIPYGEKGRHNEVLLLSTKDKKLIPKAKELAKRDGFHSFRESKYVEGELPDFTKIR